tara:strand:- start:86 stop:547 length:462 start_codon:yes stop_codon:yes gene_type:complete
MHKPLIFKCISLYQKKIQKANTIVENRQVQFYRSRIQKLESDAYINKNYIFYKPHHDKYFVNVQWFGESEILQRCVDVENVLFYNTNFEIEIEHSRVLPKQDFWVKQLKCIKNKVEDKKNIYNELKIYFSEQGLGFHMIHKIIEFSGILFYEF